MNLHDLHIQTSGISLSFSTTKTRWPIWKHPTLPQPSPKPLSHKLPVRKPLCQAVARASSSTAFKRLQVTYCTWKTVACLRLCFFCFVANLRDTRNFCSPNKKHTHLMCTRHRTFVDTFHISWSFCEACYWHWNIWNMRPGKPPKNSSPPKIKNGMIRAAYFSVQSCIFEMTRRWFCSKCTGLERMKQALAASLGQQNVADKISIFLLI